jgi:hypothetical protein
VYTALQINTCSLSKINFLHGKDGRFLSSINRSIYFVHVHQMKTAIPVYYCIIVSLYSFNTEKYYLIVHVKTKRCFQASTGLIHCPPVPFIMSTSTTKDDSILVISSNDSQSDSSDGGFLGKLLSRCRFHYDVP